MAEFLRAEGQRAEPYTLENLVTRRSQNFWLSRDKKIRLYVPRGTKRICDVTKSQNF